MNTIGLLKKSGIIILYCLFLMLLTEGVVRGYLAVNMIYDVEMTRYSNLLKKDSMNADIGHEHIPNSAARLMGVDVRINSDGLRGKPYRIEHTGAFRIAVLGDSLTFGWGVEEQDTFATRLEAALRRLGPAEVLIFGTGNYNTSQEVSLFAEKGIKYEPDMAVLFYFINDAEETPTKSKWWWLGYSRAITFYWSRVHSLIANQSGGNSFSDYYSGLYREGMPGWEKTKRSLLRLKEICRGLDIPLQVFLLPELHNLKAYPFRREHAMVIDFLRSNRIPVHDLLTEFQRFRGDSMSLWVSYDDAHPNAVAHGMIATYASETIKQRMEVR